MRGKSCCRLWPTSIITNAMASMVMPYFVAIGQRVFLCSALAGFKLLFPPEFVLVMRVKLYECVVRQKEFWELG